MGVEANAQHVSLRALAERTGLPVAWIKREAESGRIPSLLVGRRMMFDPIAVSRVLAGKSQDPSAVRLYDVRGFAKLTGLKPGTLKKAAGNYGLPGCYQVVTSQGRRYFFELAPFMAGFERWLFPYSDPGNEAFENGTLADPPEGGEVQP